MRKETGYYVYFVHTGQEDIACGYVNDLLSNYDDIAYHLLVPKRKLVEYHSGVLKVLYKNMFPGYIFIYTDNIERIHTVLTMNWHSAIFKLLKSDDQFQKVEKRELQPILDLINWDGVVEASTVFVENGKVYILDGPLINYTGVITKVNPRRKRVRVLLDFLDRKTEVDICADYLLKMDGENFENMVLLKKAVVNNCPPTVV
ncbi:MAG: antiterminator LoaP [Hungatella sp.]|jgi:transcriptional antiterminator NusG|nr:antiterminator LoaP [Hungatella sp.]